MESTALRNLGRDVLFKFRTASLALRKQYSQQSESGDEIEQFTEILTAEQERFELWAANLGLEAMGDRSLDYRIKDSSSVKSYANQLLEELAEDLSDLCTLLTEELRYEDAKQVQDDEDFTVSERGEHEAVKTPDNGDDASEVEQSDDGFAKTHLIMVECTTDAVRAMLEDISDIVDRLYRLAAKLRSSTNRVPPSARNFYREPLIGVDKQEFYLSNSERQMAKAQTEEFHSRRIEEIVRQSRRDEADNPFPSEDGSPELDPHTRAVIHRIAKGNAYRQQQFMFWRQKEWDRRHAVSRQATMMQGPPMPNEPSQDAPKLHGVPATPEVGRKDDSCSMKSKHIFSEIQSATWNMPKETDLAIRDEKESLTSKTDITTSPTIYEPSGRKVGWPAFPKELGKKKEFICPYCFATCPAKYRGKAHWRAHLIQDLQPYTCTAQACSEGDNKLLNTWEEWIVHEQVYHRMEYKCPHHPEQSFRTREIYEEHVAKRHSQEKLLGLEEIDKNAQLVQRPQSGCPLCSYKSDTWKDMDKHLAFHLEALALLSLPLATGLEKDDFHMESLHPEGGEDDAMRILDGDVAQVLSGLFETEVEPVDEEENPLPQGERVTLAALEHLNSHAPLLTARKGHEARVELLFLSGKADADLEDTDRKTTPLSYGNETQHGNENKTPPEDGKKKSSQAAETDDETLFFQLHSSLHNSALSNGKFLPLDSLEIITKERVSDELSPASRILRPGLPAEVVQKAKKLFAILVLLGESPKIRGLLQENITDQRLPLFMHLSESTGNVLVSGDGIPLHMSASWKDGVLERILDKQWLVLAPVLENSGRHFVLNEHCPLPFVEAEEIGGGQLGIVYRGELHPAHQRGLKTTDGKIRVSIKEMGFSKLDNFRRERENLEKIRELQHPHLIQHYATYERGKRYYIIFPWAAGGDLRQLWQRENGIRRTPKMVLWVLRQIAGIAGALEALHDINFRHGNLKPSNIFFFKDEIQGRLVIAGLTFSSVHTKETFFRNMGTITRDSSTTYEAPEALGPQRSARSRKYDIWSLGCILLEFLIWLLYDFEAIEVFSENRRTDSGPTPFFVCTRDRNMESHPKVTEAIEALRQDGRLKAGILETVLNLIEGSLLKVQAEERASAAEVATSLGNILWKAEEETSLAYLANIGDAPPVRPPIFQRQSSASRESLLL